MAQALIADSISYQINQNQEEKIYKARNIKVGPVTVADI